MLSPFKILKYWIYLLTSLFSCISLPLSPSLSVLSQATSLRTSTSLLQDNVIDRLCGMMAIPIYDSNTSERRSKQLLTSDICREIWRYVGCYRLGGQWVWYLPDEVGSAIGHSSEPNIICVPFIHIVMNDDNTFPTMTSYSIMWPIQPMRPGDPVERDYCDWITTPIDRICHLVDWLGEDMVDTDLVDQIITNSMHHSSILRDIHQLFVQKMHRVMATPPNHKVPSLLEFSPNLSPGGKLRVWTSPDDPLRLKHPTSGLTHPAFELVDNPSQAHILWYSEPLKETPKAWINAGYTPKQINTIDENLSIKVSGDDVDPLAISPDDQVINQFPFEGAFTIKSHLAREIARTIGLPEWWNESYDMETHLMQYVGDYLLRKRQNQDNVWIIKPSIGTRSQGHVITNSLVHSIRLLEVDKNRVAQKYVERPLLWRNGRKWDMRWIICARSFNPVELYVYNVFWARVANKSSSSNDTNGEEEVWEDREKAYTAMWVLEGVKQEEILPDWTEIIAGLEELYPSLQWNQIQDAIHKLLREVFYGLSNAQPNGMNCSHARGLYGCDIILERQPLSTATGSAGAGGVVGARCGDEIIQPKLLEVTFVPSNSAVNPLFSKQYPSYVNDVFGVMFLGEDCANMTRLL